MCTSPPLVCSMAAVNSIDVSLSDEELIMFLGERKVGDPVPANVIIEMNPFSIEPWDSPEDVWFLYSSEDSHFHNEGSIIKATENGYWKSMYDLRIPTSTLTVGKKTMMEFYVGKAPLGDKTGWMMHEYQAEKIEAEGNNKTQGYSLCRFFMQEQMPHNMEHCNPMNPAAAEGQDLESLLASLVEQEDRDSSPRDEQNKSQVVGGDVQRQLELSGKTAQNVVTDNLTEDRHATSDFIPEDFLEMNDLYDLGSSSSSSDDSSVISMNSDDYFDADALLRDIENDRELNSEGDRVDYKYNVASSVISNRVIMRPPLGGVSASNSSDLVVRDMETTDPIPAPSPTLSSSNVDVRRDCDTSTSGSSKGSQNCRVGSGSSQGGSSPRGSGSKPVGRIAKLGKRYCCFGPF